MELIWTGRDSGHKESVMVFRNDSFFVGSAVENSHINLGECVFGPEELNLLLKEWLKEHEPKTINDLARMYWAHRIERETGFLPYDRRRGFKKGEKLVVPMRINGLLQYQPAEVIKVSRNTYTDSDGFGGDIITVHLLSQSAILSGLEVKKFIANYQGEEKAGPVVKSFEIIREKDEAEVIPKILIAISNDNRLVAFQEKWLPSKLLVDFSNKLTDVRKTIAKYKQALSTRDILEEIYATNDNEDLSKRLEFSLNHFLNIDRMKRFVATSDSPTKWDLREPCGPVQVTVNRRALSDGKLLRPFGLELLLFYHGSVSYTHLTLPTN